ncbi:SDR family NAD(P)-dependent oxidoreductase [Streptomyces sp. ID05-26A]|nr:SDR family NAD(P)-dependent oxidoreductase [Streptomyces sp. ID05-26A]
MELNLKGKRALVTGSSSGLGEAIARLLAAEGADVVVHGRHEARARAVAADIGAAAVAIGDLATDAGADAVAAVAGEIDVLVNNAGGYAHTGWEDAAPREWREIYEANVISAVRMIQRLVPGMRARGWGRVIQIGGGLGSQPIAVQPHYSATLAARHTLAVSLARELKDTGVTSNVVSPGAIMVDSVEAWLTKQAPGNGWGETWQEIERNAVSALVPNDVGRFGRPEEIAGAVAYLASPYADYVSGATIRVDGGTVRSVV